MFPFLFPFSVIICFLSFFFFIPLLPGTQNYIFFKGLIKFGTASNQSIKCDFLDLAAERNTEDFRLIEIQYPDPIFLTRSDQKTEYGSLPKEVFYSSISLPLPKESDAHCTVLDRLTSRGPWK